MTRAGRCRQGAPCWNQPSGVRVEASVRQSTVMGAVHAEDIRRPLGIAPDYPHAAVIDVLNFYKTSHTLIGTKKRVAGVKLVATEADWSHGEGPGASGPLLSLLLAATGRTAGLDDLSGAGVEILRSR